MTTNYFAFLQQTPLSISSKTSQFTQSTSKRRHQCRTFSQPSSLVMRFRSDDHQNELENSRPTPEISVDSNIFRIDPNLIDKDNEENLRGFIKTRGSLIPGEEFVFWFTGDIYDLVDEGRSQHMCSFEGYNIGRMIRVDGGWRMLTREVGLYKEKNSGKILETWQNPHTGKTNQVVHVWNDPVNQQFLLNSSNGKFKVPTTDHGDDIYWNAEIFLKYKSALPKTQFPTQVGSDFYQSVEMFQFFTEKKQLASDEPSADCLISWVRVSQWLPWMEMGDRPGKLLYHCRGRKLKGGYADLSEQVRKYIEETKPEYTSAPMNYSTPNETSWTYMRKLLDAKGYPRADGTVAKPEPVSGATQLNTQTIEKVEEKMRMTKEELKEYCGENVDKAIYLSIGGRVFDVSSARRHYRRGETYNCLTGRDSSYAFISGDLSENGLQNGDNIDLDNLTEDQEKDLNHWISFFSKTYPEVGVLIDL